MARTFAVRFLSFVIFGLFILFGFFIVSIGCGSLTPAFIKLTGINVTGDLSFLINVGYAWLIIVSAIAATLSFTGALDTKDIPYSHISRVIAQNKILLIVDGVVYEKVSIKWASIALRYIKTKAIRNFYGLTLREQIFIDCQEDDSVKSEDLTSSVENHIAPEPVQVKFEIGEDEDAKHPKQIDKI